MPTGNPEYATIMMVVSSLGLKPHADFERVSPPDVRNAGLGQFIGHVLAAAR